MHRRTHIACVLVFVCTIACFSDVKLSSFPQNAAETFIMWASASASIWFIWHIWWFVTQRLAHFSFLSFWVFISLWTTQIRPEAEKVVLRRAWYASLARDQDQLDQYMRRLDNPPAPFGDMRRADGHRTGWRRETVFFFLSISLSSSLFFLSFGLLLGFFSFFVFFIGLFFLF